MDKDEILNKAKEKLDNAVSNLEKRFTTVRAGRANPSSLDSIVVDYYNSPTPLKQLSTISVPDARCLLIKPFDKSILKEMEKAILSSNLGYNPTNDGESLRITIPELTEERRIELTKQVKAISEEGKVAIRNIRREVIDNIKKNDFSEDIEKSLEKEVQTIIDKYNKIVDEKLKEKDKELMSV